MFSDVVGYGSAATLGYIAGDIPGAVWATDAYTSYRNFANSGMVSGVKRKRGSAVPVIVGSAPGPYKRRKRTKTVRRMKKSAPSTGGLRDVVAKTKNQKKVGFKRPAKVKVTKNFKAKLAKALEPKMPIGHYWNIYTDSFGTGPTTNRQYVQMLTKTGFNTQGMLFTPLQVLDAASVLWNNKTPAANIGFGDALNFNPLHTKIHCKSAYAEVKMRNNTQRTFYFTIYECAPKSDDIVSPVTMFDNAINSEIASGIVRGTVTKESLYCSPTMFKEFNQAYKVAKRQFQIEPGQEYMFNVQGPQDYVYDYAKYTNNGNAVNSIPKVSRYLLSTHYVDLVSGQVTGVGRVAATAAQDQLDDLIVETTQHYILGMPAQTGWLSSGAAPAAGPVPLTFVHDAKAFGEFQVAPTGASFNRYDETNPVTLENV